MNTLGPYLRTLRDCAGLTLRELGAQVHLSPAYLSDIERGNRTPSVEAAERLAVVLDVPLTEITSRYRCPTCGRSMG